MQQSDQNSFKIFPGLEEWAIVVICAIGAISIMLFILFEIDGTPRYKATMLDLLLIGIITYRVLRGYTVNSFGLSIYFLGLRLKQIPWRVIQDVAVIQKTTFGHSEFTLVFTLDGCRIFQPGIDSWSQYLRKTNPSNIITISIESSKKEEIMEAVRTYSEKFGNPGAIREINLG